MLKKHVAKCKYGTLEKKTNIHVNLDGECLPI